MESLGSSKVPQKSLRKVMEKLKGWGPRPPPAPTMEDPSAPTRLCLRRVIWHLERKTYSQHTLDSQFAPAHFRHTDRHLLNSSSSGAVLLHPELGSWPDPSSHTQVYLPFGYGAGRWTLKEAQTQRQEGTTVGCRTRTPQTSTLSASTWSDSPCPPLFPRCSPTLPQGCCPGSHGNPSVFGSTPWFHSQKTLPIFEPALNDNHFPQD